MSWVSDLSEIIAKLKFFEIVYEYQQGLYFRNGRVLEIRLKKLEENDRKRIAAEEKALIKQMGYKAFLPFRKPSLPEKYRASWKTGLPWSKERHAKVLQTGYYFHLPIFDDIVVDSKQERVLKLGHINVFTTDGKRLSIGCNISYEIMDLYRTYIVVDDYKDSLKNYTLSILSRYSIGKKYDEWKDPVTIKGLEKDVLKELRELVTEKWGLKIHNVFTKDVVDCKLQRILYEGPPSILRDTIESQTITD